MRVQASTSLPATSVSNQRTEFWKQVKMFLFVLQNQLQDLYHDDHLSTKSGKPRIDSCQGIVREIYIVRENVYC